MGPCAHCEPPMGSAPRLGRAISCGVADRRDDIRSLRASLHRLSTQFQAGLKEGSVIPETKTPLHPSDSCHSDPALSSKRHWDPSFVHCPRPFPFWTLSSYPCFLDSHGACRYLCSLPISWSPAPSLLPHHPQSVAPLENSPSTEADRSKQRTQHTHGQARLHSFKPFYHDLPWG